MASESKMKAYDLYLWKETEKAYLVSLSETADDTEKYWLPKSQLEYDEMVLGLFSADEAPVKAEFQIPEWVVKNSNNFKAKSKEEMDEQKTRSKKNGDDKVGETDKNYLIYKEIREIKEKMTEIEEAILACYEFMVSKTTSDLPLFNKQTEDDIPF